MRASALTPSLYNPSSRPTGNFEIRRNFTFTMPVNQLRGHRARLFLQRIHHYYRQGVAEILEFVTADKTTYGTPNVPKTNMAKPNAFESNPPFLPAPEEVELVNGHRRQEPYTSPDEPTSKGPLRVLNPDPPSPEETTSSGTWAGSRLPWHKETRATSPNIPISTAVDIMTYSRSATSISSSSLASSHQVHELEASTPATLGVRRQTNRRKNMQPPTRVSNPRSTGYKETEVECKRWSLYRLLEEIV